jgi:hypothetical protein
MVKKKLGIDVISKRAKGKPNQRPWDWPLRLYDRPTEEEARQQKDLVPKQNKKERSKLKKHLDLSMRLTVNWFYKTIVESRIQQNLVWTYLQ